MASLVTTKLRARLRTWSGTGAPSGTKTAVGVPELSARSRPGASGAVARYAAGRTEGAIERVRAAPGVQCRHERGERGRVRRAGQQTEVGETHRGAVGTDVRVMVP